ncbi:hypothetical protein Sango_1794600 [Sesamum angolense]|uniref:Uncharacterized protein n=1 Tax=Sesamum angolense TaxID=2727404 RepID=A0AAE1WH86_9LAMI|nr:hypothetical protein Sango_1794600 [Sesamum angolense]
MNFVTDLFEPRQPHVEEDPIWELDSGRAEESALEFGFGPGLGSSLGLRVVDMDSESDSEEFEVNSGFINDGDDNHDSFVLSNNNYHTSEHEREEFEWEEVSERIHFDERENLNSVINRIEEISVSSDISSSEGQNSSLGDDERAEEERNVEWEVLLAVNNLERTFEFENSEENNSDGGEVPRVNLPEDYILTMQYDVLFGQLVENENALKGSPPAAKSVVENLPSVVLTKEKSRRIIMWLFVQFVRMSLLLGRRYQLPTDDADYEKRRSERVGGGINSHLVDDFETQSLSIFYHLESFGFNEVRVIFPYTYFIVRENYLIKDAFTITGKRKNMNAEVQTAGIDYLYVAYIPNGFLFLATDLDPADSCLYELFHCAASAYLFFCNSPERHPDCGRVF